MSSATFGLIGAGGFGREVMPLTGMQSSWQALGIGECVFVEERAGPELPPVNGHRMLTLDAFLDLPGPRFFNIAIAKSVVRERIATVCEARGARPLAVQAPNALLIGPSQIGEGLVMSPFSSIYSNAVVGRYVHLNMHSCVCHDCIIEDFVTFAPGVHCNGNVHIGRHAYIGTGAMFREGSLHRKLKIGEGAVIGMGAAVWKDVAPGEMVVGNPARSMARSFLAGSGG